MYNQYMQSSTNVYLLRHEERVKDTSFFSPLTMYGHKRANELSKVLEKLNIDVVISSPYIRTLQTVKPFNKPVFLEYGLSEIQHDNVISKSSIGMPLPDYMYSRYNIDCKYEPIISYIDLPYPEDMLSLKKRAKKVFMEILKKYCNKNILIVTHRGICISILELLASSDSFTSVIDSHILNDYPMGTLTCICKNNKLTFEHIKK
jgi:2,3-bisphosphoglycerate-dependent phosphoglycerate mutase